MAENTNDNNDIKKTDSSIAEDYVNAIREKLAKRRGVSTSSGAGGSKTKTVVGNASETATTEPSQITSTSKDDSKDSHTTTFEERRVPIINPNRSQKGEKSKQLEKEEKKSKTGAKSIAKTLGIIAACILLAIGAIVGGYVAYLQIGYNRIEDMRYLSVENNQAAKVNAGQDYTITTFNIGFGAYSQDFSFFMDEGVMSNGTKTKGEFSRGYNKDEIINNVSGAINLVKSQADSDFYFFQEVDSSASRSFQVNQVQMIKDAFLDHSSSFATNFHTKYLFYPLSQPIGKTNSGIMTLSKYMVDYAIRRQLPINNGFIQKFFDLDRCFTVTKLPVYNSAKQLVLVNVHMSAYDDGSIRDEQIKMLYEYMDYEANKNDNYVIVGGDFNLALAGESGIFNNEMKTPAWCLSLPEQYNAEKFGEIGYSINYDLSSPIGTCRDSSLYYKEGVNFEVIIDGFITSSNITIKSTATIDGDFKHSDHNPVTMTFALK